ncbi:MAG: bifunctional hydroxymethylpyrimidine kinase/phosphomethylpyrimidine kinase [Syntrophaceae bacterium]|nr:bifunctional hydroxymethylpyrimidine kinase/phosphomethylpyrimidine kinase [Syntrophaceae bacterium]
MQPVKVLCIGGSDSSGGAGIQADLKAVSACGCYALNVITAVTAQDTFGVQGIFEISSEFVAKQMEVVLNDIGADAVKTGMLLTAGIVGAVSRMIKEYNIEKLVVDPVMLAKGGRNLMLAAARQALVKKLLPLSMVVTPNVPEAEKLAGMEIKSVAAMKKAARIIHKLGVQNVLIKGGHLPENKQKDVIDILFDGKNYSEYSSPRIDLPESHGTGCTYASALAAGLALGKDLAVAAGDAKAIVVSAIMNSVSLGAGHVSVNALADKLRK